MKKTNKSIYNVKDFKDPTGLWVSTYTVTTETHYLQYWTRAFRLWVKMNGRCSDTGYISKDRPSYTLSQNSFPNFQLFADWCQKQVGYENIEANGKYWSLDKDIIEQGNKDYGPNTCCFIPNEVNQLLTSKFDIEKATVKQKMNKIHRIRDVIKTYILDYRVEESLNNYINKLKI